METLKIKMTEIWFLTFDFLIVNICVLQRVNDIGALLRHEELSGGAAGAAAREAHCALLLQLMSAPATAPAPVSPRYFTGGLPVTLLTLAGLPILLRTLAAIEYLRRSRKSHMANCAKISVGGNL